ncbi:MAG: ribosome recycling factor [Myxococcota bacterium]
MADESDVAVVLEAAKEAMEKSHASLRRDYTKVRTGRASTALLDGLQVDYYGTQTPLNQLANLTVPDPRMIVISPYDKGAMAAIERAIQTSDLGLTPSNDGKVVRISIPPLTEERRKELVKQVRKLAEDHKVGVREGRRDALSMLKDLQSDGLSEDDRRRAEKQVQDVTDDFVKKIDELSAQKEKEVLEV